MEWGVLPSLIVRSMKWGRTERLIGSPLSITCPPGQYTTDMELQKLPEEEVSTDVGQETKAEKEKSKNSNQQKYFCPGKEALLSSGNGENLMVYSKPERVEYQRLTVWRIQLISSAVSVCSECQVSQLKVKFMHSSSQSNVFGKFSNTCLQW